MIVSVSYRKEYKYISDGLCCMNLEYRRNGSVEVVGLRLWCIVDMNRISASRYYIIINKIPFQGLTATHTIKPGCIVEILAELISGQRRTGDEDSKFRSETSNILKQRQNEQNIH